MINPKVERYAAGALILAVVLVSALREHDIRLQAEQTVKDSQRQVQDLKQQAADIQKAGNARIAAIQKRAASVKTPAQAIAAIPDVSKLPLGVHAIPNAPSEVAVKAVPLFNELSACRTTEVERDMCAAKLALEYKVEAEKDRQIDALKKAAGRGFWHRFGACAVRSGVGGASGGAFGGQKGAAFGAALGFGSCLVVKP